ncbi:hypothetical protein Dvina_17245 [Dactylosporangium vinaceum]|uniref:Uncharacterized protein n=1 Tax=Dactylosporangium vinaceum TaxID=53362 RepID=A0ABV5MK56_9ACTN|nr:hypothetical protein [Dactylosporangium vinaceum]UAB99657.1 hypothetical protein Dvina_17245 [Dactylosporangium vinaceum]
MHEVLDHRPGVPADPVFVDRSGRRRRLFTVFGTGVGVALTAGAALLVAGLTGSSPLPLPLLPQGVHGGTQRDEGSAGVQPIRATPRATAPSAAARPNHPPATTTAPGPTAATTPATAAPGNPHTTHPGNPKPNRSK